MSDRPPVSERRLGDILDSLVNEQRKDIKAYCSGHLNHDKLFKHPTKSSHMTWESATKPIPVMREPTKIPVPERDAEGNNKMTNTMYNFSMGTTGSIALPRVDSRMPRPHRSPSPRGSHSPVGSLSPRGSPSPSANVPPPSPSPTGNVPLSSPSPTGNIPLPSPSPSGNVPLSSPRLTKRAQVEEIHDMRPSSFMSYKTDNIYIEELILPEVMLPVPGMRTQPKSKLREPGRDSLDGKIGRYQKQRFIQSHLGEVTKRDQYCKFKEFENHILRRPDACEKGVLTGKKAVEHLEQKLQELLATLDEAHRSGGPNFHRLQIFNNVFDDLVIDTPIFGDILRAIKNEYDLYMGSLLDNQSAESSQVLYQQVQSLAASGTSATREVAEERHRLKHLEMEAKRLPKKKKVPTATLR